MRQCNATGLCCVLTDTTELLQGSLPIPRSGYSIFHHKNNMLKRKIHIITVKNTLWHG